MSTIELPPYAHPVREGYKAGRTIRSLMAEFSITKGAVYFMVDGGPKVKGERLLTAIPRRRKHVISLRARLALIARIMHVSQQQVSTIESRGAPTAGQLDSDARTLATITRTIRDMTIIDEHHRQMRNKKIAPDNDRSSAGDDEPDIDELRRSVAQTLERIIAEEGE